MSRPEDLGATPDADTLAAVDPVPAEAITFDDPADETIGWDDVEAEAAEWGPKLTEAFQASRGGDESAEDLDSKELRPDVLIVGIMRDRSLWSNIKTLAGRGGRNWKQVVRTAKSALPGGVEERVTRAGWIVSRREFEPDAPQEEPEAEPKAEAKPSEVASLLDDEAPEDDAATEEPAKSIEHIVVTNKGEILRFVGDDDTKRFWDRRRGDRPYRYADAKPTKGLREKAAEREAALAADYKERNEKAGRYTTTMKLIGRLTVESAAKEGALGPVDDQLTAEQVYDGLYDRLEKTGLVRAAESAEE